MSRISDAWDVLNGRKTAVDNAVPGLIFQAYVAALWASRRHPQTNQPTKAMPPIDTAEETAQHDTGVTRLKKINAYLFGLPALFVSIGAALEAARLEAQIGSAERKQYQDQIDLLKAQGDELEGLIGTGAEAVDAADAADDAVGGSPATPPVEVPGDGAATGDGSGTNLPPTEPPTGDASTPPTGDGAAAPPLESGFDASDPIPTAEGTGPVGQ